MADDRRQTLVLRCSACGDVREIPVDVSNLTAFSQAFGRAVAEEGWLERPDNNPSHEWWCPECRDDYARVSKRQTPEEFQHIRRTAIRPPVADN